MIVALLPLCMVLTLIFMIIIYLDPRVVLCRILVKGQITQAEIKAHKKMVREARMLIQVQEVHQLVIRAKDP